VVTKAEVGVPYLERRPSLRIKTHFDDDVLVIDLAAKQAANLIGIHEGRANGEVLGEVFEVMLGSGSDKHNIAGSECVALAIVNEIWKIANEPLMALGRLLYENGESENRVHIGICGYAGSGFDH